jgi:hypothetical protein
MAYYKINCNERKNTDSSTMNCVLKDLFKLFDKYYFKVNIYERYVYTRTIPGKKTGRMSFFIFSLSKTKSKIKNIDNFDIKSDTIEMLQLKNNFKI